MVVFLLAGRASRAERARRRAKIVLDDAALSDKTQARYYSALRKLLPYLEACKHQADLDSWMCRWVRRMWKDGEPLLTVGDGLSALHFHQPWTRRCVPHSWKLFNVWRRIEIPNRAPPLTQRLVRSMAAFELECGNLEMCAILVLSFHCLLRTGEALNLTTADFILGKDTGVVSLKGTKSGKRNQANEVISITDVVALDCIRALVQARRASNTEVLPLWSGSGSRFRQRLKLSLPHHPVRDDILRAEVVVVAMSTCAGVLLRTAKKQAPIGRENIDVIKGSEILFGEFEFSPTPETVSIAFGLNEAEPIKEWGASNAENKANYGGSSAFNLKQPAMQKELLALCSAPDLGNDAAATRCSTRECLVRGSPLADSCVAETDGWELHGFFVRETETCVTGRYCWMEDFKYFWAHKQGNCQKRLTTAAACVADSGCSWSTTNNICYSATSPSSYPSSGLDEDTFLSLLTTLSTEDQSMTEFEKYMQELPWWLDKYSYLRTRNRRYEADFHARYTGVRLNGLKTQVMFSWISFNATFPRENTVDEANVWYNRWQEFKDTHAPNIGGYQTTDLYLFLVTQNEMVKAATMGIGLSLLVAFIVLLATTCNWWSSLLGLVCIVCITATFLGIVPLLGWSLGENECIFLIATVGLSVDYTVHLLHAYDNAPVSTRTARAHASLEEMGISVANSAITTLFAAAMLFACGFYFFFQFGGFIFMVIGLSILMSTNFLMPLMMLVGPEGDQGRLLGKRKVLGEDGWRKVSEVRNNLWPAAKNIPSSLRVLFSWAERCDVELGRAWLAQGVKMADLLIATEYFLTFASCNLELAKGSDGRVSHAMRPLGGAQVFILDESLKPLPDSPEEFTGLLGVAGPQVTPGYVERLDGRALIGAGPLSEDMFKVINGEWVLVPKDIIKKRPDNSIVSIGRGGGTVKVRGGVLMATNVAELQLTTGAVSACCITEPVHVEGGASVVLELQRGDPWGLRKSLQDASFLRMPILYTCTMPRNESTGKVQKALVQELRKKEAQLEAQLSAEQRGREQSQVAWYWRMIKPVLLLILGLQPRSAWNLLQGLFSSSKLWWSLWALLGVGKESVLQLCLAAWTYGALAQAGACGQRSFAVLLLPLVAALVGTLPGALVATALLTAVLLLGKETKKWQELRQKVGRLRFSIALALLLRLPIKDASCLYSVGLLLLYAGNRRPPFGRGVVHQVAAYCCSLVESLRYMACFPVLFLLALPSMVQSELQKFAWSKLSANLSGFAKQAWGCLKTGFARTPAAPAAVEPLLKRVSGGIYWKRIWVDFEAAQDAVDADDDPMGADSAPAAPCVASSPAQICAQQLARQAGVDFRSVDSLKIARLSVLLKKYMKPQGGLEALEFNDLREAAADEGTFLRLAEERLEAPVAQPEDWELGGAGVTSGNGSLRSGLYSDMDTSASNSAGFSKRGTDRLVEFITGGLRTHREGATNAPWDCQVDVLLRWQGAEPLNEERLQRAVDFVIQQQPMLRACVPPDDSTDLRLGSRNSGFSTTVAASWSLLNELNFLEQWPKVRRAVAGAIYLCWPRTFIRSANAFKIPKLAKPNRQVTDSSIRLEVSLPSGRSEIVGVSQYGTIADLKAAAQKCFGQGFLRLAAPDGCLLDPTDSLSLSGFQDGDSLAAVALQPTIAATRMAFALGCVGGNRIVTWGHPTCGGGNTAIRHQPSNIQQICATGYAFAAVLADGTVVTWGDAIYGGDSSRVQDQLRNVQHIFATGFAIAAVLADGSVVTWGDANHGGDSSRVQDQLRNVQQILATGFAFAAVLADGSVVTWGTASHGADSSRVHNQLRNVQQICATDHAFAAVLADGTVVTWGDADNGGDSSRVQDQLRNVQEIFATNYAFAAVLVDGRVVTWGDAKRGGNSSRVQDRLRNVEKIFATRFAFAAVLADGSVVTWGTASHGGDSSRVHNQLRKVQQIFATEGAFAAVLADGTVVTWGVADNGGDSSRVQDQLRKVQQICATEDAFAAVSADGSLVTWGNAKHGIGLPPFISILETSSGFLNLADEVYRVMNESGWAWWRSDSSLNMCLIQLEQNSEVTSCVYCSVTHKYADGGAVAAFVTALSEAYAMLERGEMPSCEEHPVLAVQEQRLWRYLEGLPGREGQVDVYLFDIVNDMYNHKWGHSVGVDFTMKICDLVRAAGRRMACSEEIAWICCMSCAMLRLMPDEEMLKLMIVHNGRLGDAEGAVACVSNYVMLRIPCLERGNTPVADICSRVKYMVTHGQFSRPRSTEQAHARLNIGGMIGTDGNFVQLFKTGRGRDPSWSRAPYVIQLRMDNEGGIWCVKDFKCHEFLDPTTFWRAAVGAAQEIAEGNFTTPVAPATAAC
eukprot:s86_g18.t1